ncbi:MAG TPA: TolC family protein [Firmicutes bacterium]|nr:TolC family protein [Bacillota bacterium]
MNLSLRKLSTSLGVTLVLCLMVVGVVAAESSVLTLPQATELALTNSISLQIAKLNYDNSKIAYDKAILADPTPLQKRNADITWESAQATFRSAKNDVIISVFTAYMSVLSAMADVEIKEKQAQQALNNWERTKILVAKGNASPTNELQAEMSNMTAQNNLDRSRDSLASALYKLQHLLGLDKLPDQLADVELIAPPLDVDLESAIAAGLAANTQLKSLRTNYELLLLQREQDLATGLAPLDDRKSQNDLKVAELNLAEAEANSIDSITTQYNSLLQALKGIAVSEASLILSQKQYDITKKQVDAGMKTPNDLLADEINLLSAKNSLHEAYRSYVSSWMSFQKTLGRDINISEVVKSDGSK